MADQNIDNMTQSWNSGGTTFTAVKMNVTDTSSAAASLLIDLQVGGASKFSISKAGKLTTAGGGVFAGVVEFPDGSAAAPSVTNTGDTDTGIYWSGADELGFATGGTVRGTLSTTAFTLTVAITSNSTITTTAAITGVGLTSTNGLFGADATIGIRPNGIASSTGQLVVAQTGNVTANGTMTASNFITTSEAGMKDDFRPLAGAEDVLDAISAQFFKWKETGEEALGFVIDDAFERAAPWAVTRNDDGVRQLNLIPMLAYLWNAVKAKR